MEECYFVKLEESYRNKATWYFSRKEWHEARTATMLAAHFLELARDHAEVCLCDN